MALHDAVVTVAVLAAAAVIGVALAHTREGFVSPAAHKFAAGATELFGATRGAASFGDFRRAVREAAPAADAVQYTDARDLWRKGALTPAAAQKLL
jgi:hypothetical protein